MKRFSIAVVLATLTAACSESASPPQQSAATVDPTTRAAESGPCAGGFVAIAANQPACGISLETDGSLTVGGRRTAPIIVSYQEGAAGQVPLPARQVVLFPPSSKGLRVVQACETPNADSLCWAVRMLDTRTAALLEIAAGKYGPSHWISWSPDERRVALVSRNEGAAWLHIVDTATGAAGNYPADSVSENWEIDRESFTWTGKDAFSVVIKTCKSCAPETRSFTLP